MAGKYGFEVAGIEPVDIELYGLRAQREFWKAVVVLTLVEKDAELARGLDVYGDKLVPIAESTRRNRRSWTGKADPNAPPLTPAYRASRTRVLLDGRAGRNKAEFFWRADPVSGRPWGRVLGYHREGAGYLPERDVIGLSPKSLARIKAAALKAWERIRKGEAAPKKTDVIGRLNLPKPELAKPKAKPKPKKATTTTTTRPTTRTTTRAPLVIYLKPGQKPSRTSRAIQVYEEPEARPKPKRDRKPAPKPVIKVYGKPAADVVKEAKAVVKALPDKIKAALKAQGIEVSIGHGILDVAPQLKGITPRGWDPHLTWENAEGCYNPNDKKVITCETRISSSTGQAVKTHRFAGVLRHETGHAFDHALNYPSQDPGGAFHQAYDADVANIPGTMTPYLTYFLQTGSAGRSEAFAEVFAQAIGSGSASVQLASYFPRCLALILGLIA